MLANCELSLTRAVKLSGYTVTANYAGFGCPRFKQPLCLRVYSDSIVTQLTSESSQFASSFGPCSPSGKKKNCSFHMLPTHPLPRIHHLPLLDNYNSHEW